MKEKYQVKDIFPSFNLIVGTKQVVLNLLSSALQHGSDNVDMQVLLQQLFVSNPNMVSVDLTSHLLSSSESEFECDNDLLMLSLVAPSLIHRGTRISAFLVQKACVQHGFANESETLRYLKALENRDIGRQDAKQCKIFYHKDIHGNALNSMFADSSDKSNF